MQDPIAKLKAANADIEHRDTALRDELAERRDSAKTTKRSRAARDEPEMTIEGVQVNREEFIAETIVRRTGRPVLAILRDEGQLTFTDPDSVVWKPRLEAAKTHLVKAARAIGRIEVEGHALAWLGTGWLVDRDIIVTNRHVAAEFGRRRGTGFVFRQGLRGTAMSADIDFIEEFGRTDSLVFRLARILHIEDENGPDVAFLRVEAVDGQALATPIPLETGVPSADEQVAVIGYPARDSRIPDQELMEQIFGDVFDKKRLAPGLVTRADRQTVRHDCSTLGGNSGSAVVSLATGRAVALHFAGRFLETNFAVPSTVVGQRLQQIRSGSRPGRVVSPPGEGTSAVQTSIQSVAPSPGQFSFVVPIRFSVDVGTPQVGSRTDAPATAPPEPGPRPEEDEDDDEEVLSEAVPEDYRDRDGYDPTFLRGSDGGSDSLDVPFPVLTRNKRDVLKFTFDGETLESLPYRHFSVVMSRSRRLCRVSGVNIDGKESKKKKRVGWRSDPRIANDAQIRNECYGNPPRFARGHMTRREDPIWGSDAAAVTGNADSMHVTNAVPQMQPFNAGIWLGLEDYALDHAREDDMRISVFTGPFLNADDPVHFGVQIPVRFWKVIAFVHDDTGELCATGYSMSQEDFIREEEFVFGRHKTSQVSIRSIEQQAGLSFGPLADLDPFGDVEESIARPLGDFREIRFTRR